MILILFWSILVSILGSEFYAYFAWSRSWSQIQELGLNVFWMQDKFLWTKNFHFKCVLIKINIIKLFLHNSIFPFIIPTNSCKKNKITESCLLMQRFIAAIRKGRIFNFGGERMIKAEIVINYELSDRAIKQL